MQSVHSKFAAQISALGLVLSSFPHPTSARARFPFHVLRISLSSWSNRKFRGGKKCRRLVKWPLLDLLGILYELISPKQTENFSRIHEHCPCKILPPLGKIEL